MKDIQLQTVEQLVSCGFHEKLVREMVSEGLLPCPLTSGTFLNVQLLGRYADLHAIPAGECDRVARFLRQDHSVSAFQESVPDRYSFTQKQRQAYFAEPLEWEISCDLKAKLDDQLKQLIPDAESRMDIYREMYCNGAWWDCDTIGRICLEVRSIADGHADLEETFRKWWFILFSLYSGALQYIDRLKELFEPEHVWEIFRDTIANVREFPVQFNPFDRKETVLKELREKYPQYLKKPSDS